MLRIQEAEARTAACKENERIAELKIRTLGRAMIIPQDELESLVTAQEITDEEIDRARGGTIEARAGSSKRTAKPRTVKRSPSKRGGSVHRYHR